MNVAYGLSFAAAFAVSVGFSTSACSSPDCGCPDSPPLPAREAPFTNAQYTFGVSTIPSPLQGSVEVTGREVVIVYEGDGSKHEIRYAVESN